MVSFQCWVLLGLMLLASGVSLQAQNIWEDKMESMRLSLQEALKAKHMPAVQREAIARVSDAAKNLARLSAFEDLFLSFNKALFGLSFSINQNDLPTSLECWPLVIKSFQALYKAHMGKDLNDALDIIPGQADSSADNP